MESSRSGGFTASKVPKEHFSVYLYSYIVVQLNQYETIKNYQNVIVNDLKDQIIGMYIKQTVIIKIQQRNLAFFLNQVSLGSIDVLMLKFLLTQIKILLLKDIKLEGITQQKELLIITTLSSMKKTFMINQLILI